MGAEPALGLSQVYGFVNQSGGHVTLYSDPGVGTTARIYLPKAEAVAAASLRARQPTRWRRAPGPVKQSSSSKMMKTSAVTPPAACATWVTWCMRQGTLAPP